MKRIYRRWEDWECYKSGFYDDEHPILSHDECSRQFKEYFMIPDNFEKDIDKIFDLWPASCENFLSNTSINRVAWLGQACVCLMKGIPSKYKGAYLDLSEDIQKECNDIARKAVKRWEDGCK